MKSWTVDKRNKLKKILGRLSAEDGKYICRVIYRDPLTDIYKKLLIIYVFIIVSFLLWPFDFLFLSNDAGWIGKSKGIEFLGIGQAMSNSPTQEFFDRMVKGSGLTELIPFEVIYNTSLVTFKIIESIRTGEYIRL